jgi:hypothetical protein
MFCDDLVVSTLISNSGFHSVCPTCLEFPSYFSLLLPSFPKSTEQALFPGFVPNLPAVLPHSSQNFRSQH